MLGVGLGVPGEESVWNEGGGELGIEAGMDGGRLTLWCECAIEEAEEGIPVL